MANPVRIIGKGDGGIQADVTVNDEVKVFLDAASSGITTDANPQTFEDISFVTEDSPVTLDANTALGRNATQFAIQNDGAGNFTVATSNNGSIFGDEKTMKAGEIYGIDNVSVDSIRITWISNSAYRAVVI